MGQRIAPGLQRGLDAGLDTVDLGTARALFVSGQATEGLEQLRDPTGTPEVAGLGILEIGCDARRLEVIVGLQQKGIEFVHRHSAEMKEAVTQGGGLPGTG
jgi:hypothetical protein